MEAERDLSKLTKEELAQLKKDINNFSLADNEHLKDIDVPSLNDNKETFINEKLDSEKIILPNLDSPNSEQRKSR